MPEQTTQDANTAATSSPAAAEGAAGQAQTQAAAPTKEKTLAEVAREAFESATKPEAEGASQDLTPTGEEAAVEGVETEENGAEEATTETTTEAAVEATEAAGEEADPPFHTHPAWKKKTEKLKSVEERLAKAVEEATQVKPLLEAATMHFGFLQQNGIDPASPEVAAVMDFLALRKADPVRARERIKPLVDELAVFDPNVMPADLKAKLDEGTIDEATAKELTAMRVQNLMLQNRTQRAGFTAQQIKDQVINDTATQWVTTKQENDPDFRPKSAANAPDGLYEVTYGNFLRLAATQPLSTPKQVLDMYNAAYASAKVLFKSRLAPARKPTPPVPNSQRASASTKTEPKTVREVALAVARRHKIAVPAT